jgi:hypothetical protein
MSVKRLVPLNAFESPQDPISGKRGDIYFNTTDNTLKFYTGTEWMATSTGAGVSYSLENHIHTYDGDIHTIYAGDFNPQLTIFDGGTSASQFNESKDLDGGTI